MHSDVSTTSTRRCYLQTKWKINGLRSSGERESEAVIARVRERGSNTVVVVVVVTLVMERG